MPLAMTMSHWKAPARRLRALTGRPGAVRIARGWVLKARIRRVFSRKRHPHRKSLVLAANFVVVSALIGYFPWDERTMPAWIVHRFRAVHTGGTVFGRTFKNAPPAGE